MAERLRGRAAVKQRKRRLAAEPLCRDCREQGIIPPRLATVPDHIVPLAQGGTDDDTNVRCICAEHHKVRTAEQFGHRVKVRIGENGWPVESETQHRPA